MGHEYPAKTFKSGNSVALRLPAALGIAEGTRMTVREQDGSLIVDLAERPRRKFNIDKVAGSATSLRPIADEDRVFEERELIWREPADPA